MRQQGCLRNLYRPRDELPSRRVGTSLEAFEKFWESHGTVYGSRRAQECAYFALPLESRFLCLQTAVVSAGGCDGPHENLIATSPSLPPSTRPNVEILISSPSWRI